MRAIPHKEPGDRQNLRVIDGNGNSQRRGRFPMFPGQGSTRGIR